LVHAWNATIRKSDKGPAFAGARLAITAEGVVNCDVARSTSPVEVEKLVARRIATKAIRQEKQKFRVVVGGLKIRVEIIAKGRVEGEDDGRMEPRREMEPLPPAQPESEPLSLEAAVRTLQNLEEKLREVPAIAREIATVRQTIQRLAPQEPNQPTSVPADVAAPCSSITVDTVRAHLRKVIGESGLTYQEIGRRMSYPNRNTADAVLSRLLSPKSTNDPRLSTLIELAKALGKPLDELLGKDDR
jgi:hypothetical protein